MPPSSSTHLPHLRPRRVVQPAAVGLLLALVSACGSTVAVESRSTAGLGGNLGTGASSATVAPGTAMPAAGSAVPGAEGSVGDGFAPRPGGVQASVVPGSARATTPGALPQPVQVGFVVVDYSDQTAAVTGTSSGPPPDPQRFNKWFVHYYNAHGGLAGRKIQPVYYTINSSEGFSAGAEGACTSFTQDHHVAIVVSSGEGNPLFASCLLRAGIAQIEGSFFYGDEYQLARTPNLFSASDMALDRVKGMVITNAVRKGWLTTSSKLGVVVEQCPAALRTENNVIKPLGAKYHLRLDVIEAYACGDGSTQSIGTFSAGVQNAELKMRADGVTDVMFVSQGDNGNLVFFSNYAESQHWNPNYLVDSGAAAGALAEQGLVQKDQLAHVRGFGWWPDADTQGAPQSAALKHCIATAASAGGPRSPTQTDLGPLESACDAFAELHAAMTRTGGATSLGVVRAALEGLGPVVSAINLASTARFTPSRHDGAYLVAPFGYVTGCGCMRYVGGNLEVP
jgi:hypothetical protein